MGVSPFDKPEMETVAVPIPSLTWPLVWLALTGYLVLASFIDFTIDREGDAAEALYSFPFCLACFWAAQWFHKRRVEQREQWRQKKFTEWLHKPLSPPPYTDWDRFEYDVARMVAAQEDPQRLGNLNGKRADGKRRVMIDDRR